MTGDGTLSIQYNELNLPKQVTGTPAGAVTYTYGADGRKLAKQTTSETRQYVGGIEYIGTTIDLLHTEAGIVRNNAGAYTYEFFHTDYLGNARIVYSSSGAVLQAVDYYPFGLDIVRSQVVSNKYLYNGKEKQDELTQYDYGARFYDPLIGRWHVVDPLADKTLDPYGFTYNNPVNLIDPTGMAPTDWYATRNKEGSFSMAWFDATSASLTWNNQLYLNVGNDRSDEVGAMLNASNVLSGFENRVERATSDNLVSRSFQEYPALPVSGNTATISPTPPISGGIIGEAFHAARNSYLSYKGTTKGATNIEFLKVALTGVIGEAVIGLAAAKGGSALLDASNAAFKAADDIGSIFIKNKHLSVGSGNFAKFATTDISTAQGWVRQALRSPNAMFLPNSQIPNTFQVITNLGTQVGTKGQSSIRAIVGFDGRVINAFPVR